MTERSAARVERSANALRIGSSRLAWDGAALTLFIDEITAPWPARVRGQVRLTPSAVQHETHALDAAGRHSWRPIAPCAEVEVEFERPALRWRGTGYFDTNHGSAPLEDDFSHWHWSRAHTPSGGSTVMYDVARRDGSERGLALEFEPGRARARAFAAPPTAALAATRWGVARSTRSDAGATPVAVRSFEDGPFYARSLVDTQIAGQRVLAVHESLDLDRFASPWVQCALPFRMPRRA